MNILNLQENTGIHRNTLDLGIYVYRYTTKFTGIHRNTRKPLISQMYGLGKIFEFTGIHMNTLDLRVCIQRNTTKFMEIQRNT